MPKKYVPKPMAPIAMVIPDDPPEKTEDPADPVPGTPRELFVRAKKKLWTAPAEAEAELVAAANAGNIDAMLWLGKSCYTGMILQKDPAAAAAWFKKAADAGDPGGETMLGRCYLRGVGVKHSDYQARLRFEHAAKTDYPPALFWAGFCAFFARGQLQDRHKGFAYFLRGAQLGDAPCLYALAYCYAGGRAVFRNTETAIRLLRRAAKKNFPLAYEKLGDLYSREGPLTDKEKARRCYLLAYKAGITRAKKKLAALTAEKTET